MFNQQTQELIFKMHQAVFPFPKNWMDADGQEANDLIKTYLQSDAPCLIARVGKTEIEAVMASRYQNDFMLPWSRIYRFFSRDIPYKGWKKIAPKLCALSGVFPTEEAVLHKFAEIYTQSMPSIDLIGSWLHAEIMLQDIMPNVKRIPLRDLEPYLFKNPWSESLKGKRVLVVHPFTASIKAQYQKRTALFDNTNVLPEFELVTVKAVQSLGAGKNLPFTSWFEALDSMKQIISSITFDIAIIGAGAYGLPLAAYIKSLGKKAVHLGGASQLLFGIYGTRWENDPRITPLINRNWIRPLDEDKIDHYKQIENGCYW